MKILYIINEDVSNKSSGVIQKVESQLLEWNKLGHDAEVLNIQSYTNIEGSLFKFIPKKLRTLFILYLNTFHLRKNLKGKEIDCIYSRYILFTPFLSFLNDFNYTIELNSKDIEEYKRLSKPLYLYSLLTRGRSYSIASKFVAISNEIKQYYSEFNKPTIVIGNASPDLSAYNIKKHQTDIPIIGFIGTENCPWHGLEKFIFLAKKLPQFKFEIIGNNSLVELPNLKYYGNKDQAKAINIMSKWSVAVSTLSLHYKNMEEASPLKSRLYLAMEIPFIYAYKDTDGPFQNCLEIPNSPSNVEMSLDDIKSFILKNSHRCWNKNKKDLSFQSKNKIRLDFILNKN